MANSEQPQDTMRMTLDDGLAVFATAWASGHMLAAVHMAKQCNYRWNAIYLEETQRRMADSNGEFEWPNPGCAEADEATGWGDWYGGYADTGA